jgi:hypothetical protein
MDAGRLAWCRSPTKSEQGVTRPSRLLLRLPDCKELIVANIWDSRDSAGRVFPFSFFVVVPPEALGADPIEQWVAARSIHQELQRCHTALSGFSGGGDFYKLYAKYPITPRPADLADQVAGLRQEAAGLSAADWFRGWSPDGKLDPGMWFSTIARRAAEWRGQPDSARSLALSCPLASDYSYPAQVICWLSLLEGIGTRSGKPLTVIGPGTEMPQGASLHFLARDPKPDDFQLLCSDAGRYGFIENLAAIPAAVQTVAPPAAPSPGETADVAASAGSLPGSALPGNDIGQAGPSATLPPSNDAPAIPLLEWMLRNSIRAGA